MKDNINFKNLRLKLLEIENSINYKDRINNDPVKFIHLFPKIRDREIAGLIASSFAYGNVKLIIKILDKIFSFIGESPLNFIKNMQKEDNKDSFLNNFYYRFNNADDLKTLLWCIGKVIDKWGSLENLFWCGYKSNNLSFELALDYFSKTFKEISKYSPYKNLKNFSYFFPSPLGGSPCKRLCLFMRWMCRKDKVDPGGWTKINKANLVVPVDAHISRISRYFGFTKIKNPSWKMAIDITKALKKIESEDPLRFDFSLCHMGISGECPYKFDIDKCSLCVVKDLCLRNFN